MQGQARARPDLGLIARRQGDGDSGGNQPPAAGRQLHRLGDRGQEIEARGMVRRIGGKRQTGAMGQALQRNFDGAQGEALSQADRARRR
jgi:hypothetical protein